MNGSTTKQIININIGQAINALTSQFTKTSSSRLDAQVLLSHIIQQPRSWVLAHGDYTLTPIQYHRLADAVTFLEAESHSLMCLDIGILQSNFQPIT